MKAQALVIAVSAFVISGVYAVSAQQPRSQWDGVYTEAQVTRGNEVYNSRCAQCHMADLSGGEPEEGIPAPALYDEAFEGRWNSKTMKDFADKIHLTMPADEPGVLTMQQSVDALAVILQRRKFPVGTTELPVDPAALGAIRYLTKK